MYTIHVRGFTEIPDAMQSSKLKQNKPQRKYNFHQRFFQ